MIWEYYCYLHPYEGWRYRPEKITHFDERVEKAINIAINLPHSTMKNTFMDQILRYEKTHFSLTFAAFYRKTKWQQEERKSYTITHPTINETIKMTTSAVHMLDLVDGKVALTSIEQQGIYGMFNVRTLQLAAGLIEAQWAHRELPCDDVMVENYKAMRTKIFDRLKGIMPDEASLRKKITEESRKADAIVKQRCDIVL